MSLNFSKLINIVIAPSLDKLRGVEIVLKLDLEKTISNKKLIVGETLEKKTLNEKVKVFRTKSTIRESILVVFRYLRSHLEKNREK